MPCQSLLFSQLTNESPSQSIFTHARQRIQAGEELQSAQSSVQEQEVESDKEAGSEGEDDDEEVCDVWVKLTIFESPIIHSVCPPNVA